MPTIGSPTYYPTSASAALANRGGVPAPQGGLQMYPGGYDPYAAPGPRAPQEGGLAGPGVATYGGGAPIERYPTVTGSQTPQDVGVATGQIPGGRSSYTDPKSGATYLSDPSQTPEARLAAMTAADNESLRMQREEGPILASQFDLLSGKFGSGAAPAQVQPLVAPPNDAAAAAAFARAKDTTGQISRSALDSEREAMAERGLSGSSIEGTGVGDIVGAGAKNLSDVTREQAIQDYQRAGDVANRNYEGNITQRAQNITAQGQRMNQLTSLLSLLRRSGTAAAY